MVEFLVYLASLIAIIGLGFGLRLLFTRRFVGDESWQGDDDPEKIDPYDIAYTRDGSEEVARLVSFSLFLRGYLKITSKVTGSGSKQETRGALLQASQMPSSKDLTPPEKDALSFFKEARTAKDIHGTLSNQLVFHLKALKEGLLDQRLLLPSVAEKISDVIFILVLFAIIAAGVWYGMTEASVWWVALGLAIGAGGVLFGVTRCPPQTARGRSYVEAVRQSLKTIREGKENLAKDDLAFELLMGAYGLSVLADTVQQDFLTVFPKAKERRGDHLGGCGGCG